jgi:type III secretion protein U
MSGGGDEDKPLPASKKKLEDAREKGEVPHSTDFTTALVMAASAGYLISQSGTILSVSIVMFDQAGALAAEDFTPAAWRVATASFEVLMRASLPLFGIATAASILSTVIATPGLVFAIDPIMPELSKLNPVTGFKNLFALKSLVELLKSILKLACLGCIIGIVLWQGVGALALSPFLGLQAVLEVFGRMATEMLLCTVLVFMIVGVADILMQRWLFLRDQKMSLQEMKEERKNIDGNPEVKQEQKKLMKEDANAPQTGVQRATLILIDSGRVILGGFRYVAGETPVPVVVCSAKGTSGRKLRDQAIRFGIPMQEDAVLAKKLFDVQVGHTIPADIFGLVADAIARMG